jgi:hypothetical protein
MHDAVKESFTFVSCVFEVHGLFSRRRVKTRDLRLGMAIRVRVSGNPRVFNPTGAGSG